MNISEAISDPKRPLTIPPMEWVRAASAKLAADASRTAASVSEQPIETAAAAKPNEKNDEDAMGVIESSVDAMVDAVERCYAGLQTAEMTDLRPEQRKAFDKVKELLDTAIAPYLADAITALDSLEQE